MRDRATATARVIAQKLSYLGRGVRFYVVLAGRLIAQNLPVILDVAAFVVIVVGASRLFGDWAWLVAGGLLILAGIRAES